MSKVKVGVAGYGVIGQRLADGVALLGDMELVGVADVAPTLAVRALHESGMPYKLFLVDPARKPELDARRHRHAPWRCILWTPARKVAGTLRVPSARLRISLGPPPTARGQIPVMTGASMARSSRSS